MPRGSRPGERRGGIRKGGHHKRTIEKAIATAAVLERASANGAPSPLGKDTLGKFMVIYTGLAAKFQPPPGLTKPSTDDDWKNLEQFERWARLAVDCARWLAPFQSPTFRAIMVQPPPPDLGDASKRFTLKIFDDNKLIEHVAGEVAKGVADDD